MSIRSLERRDSVPSFELQEENVQGLLGCPLGDICHDFHPVDAQHQIKKPSHDYRVSHHRHPNRHQYNHGNLMHGVPGRGNSSNPPSGAPMLYVSPAPFSSFESQLQMPGLQCLFRRHSAVVLSLLCNPAQRCFYSNFGDDWGLRGELREPRVLGGKHTLPTPIRE